MTIKKGYLIILTIAAIALLCSCRKKAPQVPDYYTTPVYKSYATPAVKNSTDYTAVNFPDPNLQAAVVAWLGKTEDSVITKNDVNSIGYLDISSKQISSLEGIDVMENLNVLVARNNSFTDLTPVTKLKKLSGLDLESNNISDISVLAGADMPALVRIWLGNNNITDIPVFSNKPALDALYMQNNKISDISGLISCTKLVHLFISNNNVRDISVVSSMNNLIVCGIDHNRDLSDLSPLSNNRIMLEFYASSCNISDISVVSNWVSLKNLDLGHNNITDITPVMESFNSGAYRAPYWNCYVNIYGNPLGFKAINCDLPMLNSFGLSINLEHEVIVDMSAQFISNVEQQQKMQAAQ